MAAEGAAPAGTPPATGPQQALTTSSSSRQSVDGVLLLYHHPAAVNAPTIMEHVDAFTRHSRFPVSAVNTEYGFPKRLRRLEFGAVVLHYSLFGIVPYRLDGRFEEYLERTSAYKIAFFQDEHRYCSQRFAFLERHGVGCVFTCLEPSEWDAVYRARTSVPSLVHTLPGYVGDGLVAAAERLRIPDERRSVDVGYRGRTLDFYMGRGGQEKAEIGRRFLERARGLDLRLDIAVDEESRIYGDRWLPWLANCRGVLGVEAGVSIFDLGDVVREESERLLERRPDMTFDELSAELLDRWEGNVYYRTVSPRHFEAAALDVCQILYEGRYSGALQPMVHYIPLRKDFSNFDEVLGRFRDRAVRRELAENAYRDLIASGRFSYRRLLDDVDDVLAAAGLRAGSGGLAADRARTALAHELRRRQARKRPLELLDRPFPGRRLLRPLRRAHRSYRAWRGSRSGAR